MRARKALALEQDDIEAGPGEQGGRRAPGGSAAGDDYVGLNPRPPGPIPRAVYLDFPLGRTAGKAGDVVMQRAVMRAALATVRDAKQPGEMVELPYRWADTDDWKDGVMRPKPGGGSDHADDRSDRLPTPQYQTDEDAALADPECATCVFPDL